MTTTKRAFVLLRPAILLVALLLLLLPAVVGADVASSAREVPELTLGMTAKQVGGILTSDYEPVLKWTHGGQVLGCDYAVRCRE